MNLYDVLAGQGTTHFERLFSQRFAGGAVQTLTGIPPLSFKADGKPLISWSMKGNGQQTGTPTPDAPIMPEFVGVRTANLIPVNDATVESENAYANFTLARFNLDAGTYRLSSSWSQLETVTSIAIALRNDVTNENIKIWFLTAESGEIGGSFTLTEKTAVKFVVWPNNTSTPKDVKCRFYDIMLNTGSTAQPFEPFGYKIPITCAGQTIPVYLGQTQTVRRIKKLVLTGEETWNELNDGIHRTTLNGYMRENTNIPLCTHYAGATPVSGANHVNNLQVVFLISATGNNYMYIRDSSYTSAADYKSYLAQQYANGTPVTVWYVLAEPETAIVNEPLCKIGDYADELHSTDAGVSIPTAKGQNTLTVDTELQPSSMTITFK